MVKKGSLTKQEKFYIKENPEKKTVCELAKELDRSPGVVAKHYIQPAFDAPVEPVPTPPVANPEAPMFQLMGRHKRNNTHVSTVMTKAASELADATRPARIANKKIQSAIHKPKG